MLDTNLNLRWSSSISYTPYSAYGYHKEKGYIFIGGDYFHEDYYGKLKDIKLYYSDAISKEVIYQNMINFN